MLRRCSICGHEKRGAIDKAVITGTPLRGMARTFRVSEDASTRHMAWHVRVHGRWAGIPSILRGSLARARRVRVMSGRR